MDRIIGGVEARAHSWPWQCSIRYKYTTPPWGQFCGASVLTRRHVVTAAHCMLVLTVLTSLLTHVVINYNDNRIGYAPTFNKRGSVFLKAP